MSKKFTPWFPTNIKPVYRGAYETNYLSSAGGGYVWWDGARWGYTANTPAQAKRHRGLGADQKKEWRGLLKSAAS